MDKITRMEQEIIDLKDELEGKDREIRKAKRESEKLRREVQMLKEELQIVGGTESANITHEYEQVYKKSTGTSKTKKNKSTRYQSPN